MQGLRGYFLLITVAAATSCTGDFSAPAFQRAIQPHGGTDYKEAELALVEGKNEPGLDLAALSTSTPARVEAGKTAFMQTCFSCHGNTGKGDGVAAAALKPKPRDFTDLSVKWSVGKRFADVFTGISKGVPGTAMPPFDYLSVEDRFNLVHFIRSLAAGYPKTTDSELSELNQKFTLSTPKKSASQIPVSVAMKLLVKESKEQRTKIISSYRSIAYDRGENSALIRRIAPRNPLRLLTALTSSDKWKASGAALKRMILADPVQLSLQPSSLNLTDAEWEKLYTYMMTFL